MPIRCPKCGYSNDPEFRFCGMCGAPLNRQYDEPIRPKPVPPAREKISSTPTPKSTAVSSPERPSSYGGGIPEERRTRVEEDSYSPVNGPSFLGLSPSQSTSEPSPGYLLEDEEPRGRGRFLLGILLLLGVSGGLYWQWQHEGYPWNPDPKRPASSASEPVDSTTPTTDATQPTPQPAPPPAKPDAAAATDEKSPVTKDEVKPDEAKEQNKDEGEAVAAATEKQKVEEPPPATAKATKPELEPAKATAAPPNRAKRQVREPAREPEEEIDPSEALFIEGQKYLYGSGVPEDCTRARQKLMAAANQSNAKAQSTVGTMYATGHCLPRNLPSAYHWFAVALHNDRDNGRLQRDLEVIWSQMTAEEKEIAIKGR
jgi:hypothetical protein